MARTKPARRALLGLAGPNDDAPLDLHAAEALMRWVGVAMFLLGSATLLATLPMPDPNTSDHPAIEVISGLLLLGAAFVFLLRPGRRWVSRVTVVYGILLVSTLMAVTRPIEATPFFYLWPLVFSAYFCTRREVAFDLVLVWGTLAAALFIWGEDPMKPALYIAVGISVTLVTVVVKLLAEHVGAVIGQLERAADTDYLTGLLNRRAFDVEFREQCDRAQRSGVPIALATFDLDHFKQINDRHGHAEGDRVLREFAALLERELRGGDTLARVGGEEFAVVLFGVGLREAVAFAERIGRELAEQSASAAREVGSLPPLSTSAGVAELSPEAPDPAALMLLADRALYAAKAAGRRRVAAWEGGTARVEAHISGEPPPPREDEIVARAI
ncbi:MAG TPA: GGDEF domain-containing protein [Solirubrobacteraceae bacterium]|nr:GGDEF domain-containing protein [Solirubrobacteraceae bacterium]